MGNTAAPLKPRERTDSGSGVSGRKSAADDDQCPVMLKMAKNSSDGTSMASLQFEHTDQYPVVVKWAGGTGSAKAVSICGSWDGWKRRIPLVKSHDDFTTIMNLPEGKHEFKFYVDGQWICDNNLPKTDNSLGTENNVIMIDRGDFEVFDALDRDLAAANMAKGSGDSVSAEGTAKPFDENQKTFGQDIPDRRDFEKATHPPVLPPHLLQVILNKDTPVSCDPNVLPEPNHVMLNHLYALSIKDGVMVLSGTHRYRKKYVTTLLYKPI